MQFTKPFPKILDDKKQITQTVSQVIQSKHWKDFVVEKPFLILVPFSVFEFEAFTEKIIEGKGNIVSNVIHKSTALNSVTLELNEELSNILLNASEYSLSENEPYSLLKQKIESKELKSLALIRLSQKYSVDRTKIIILQFKEVYFPMWKIVCTIADHSLDIFVNSATGEVMNSETIPEREKGWMEITQETLNDLKNPQAWIIYSQEIMSSIVPEKQPLAPTVRSSNSSFFENFKKSITNSDVQLVVLIVILFALIYLATH
ncbi:MAG: hypothetical protein Q7S92_03950 [Candidatus Diapherotrites archaeon]|nr:hypothetical protein [Candidatus Diapherotrites archaeon]